MVKIRSEVESYELRTCFTPFALARETKKAKYKIQVRYKAEKDIKRCRAFT
jgi:hypothetical protein